MSAAPQNPSQRKANGRTSANHLLNFSFAERLPDPPTSLPPPRRSYRRPARPFNRDIFVNASYHFVVSNDVEYSSWLHSPDARIAWSNIQEVLVIDDMPHCPVCLSPPVAAKMTKCGHVFCWTCFLQCMAYSSEPKYCLCPLCFESVYPADIRPVRCLPHKPAVTGDTIDLVLVKRPKDISLALPRDQWHPLHLQIAPQSDARLPTAPFFKIMRSTSLSVIQLIAREAEELYLHYSEAIASDEHHAIPFFEQALSQLHERALLEPNLEEVAAALIGWSTVNRVIEIAAALPSTTLPDQSKFSHPTSNDTNVFLFYQAADGRRIYMHPLFLRIFATAAHGYSNLPDRITVPIAEVESISIDDDIRKKQKFLSHLPLTTAIKFIAVPNTSLPDPSRVPHEVKQYRSRMQQQGKGKATELPAFSKDMYAQLEDIRASPIVTSEANALQLENFPAMTSAAGSAKTTKEARPTGSYASMASKSTFDYGFPSWGAATASSATASSSSSKEAINGESSSTQTNGKKRPQKQVLFSTTASGPRASK